jgi:hypothetical protein
MLGGMPPHDAKVDGRMGKWQIPPNTCFPNSTSGVEVAVKWHATFHIRFLYPSLLKSDLGHGEKSQLIKRTP